MSLNHTREERGLLGKPSRVGAVRISTGMAPRERRGARVQNREIEDGGGIEHCKESKCPEMLSKCSEMFGIVITENSRRA